MTLSSFLFSHSVFFSFSFVPLFSFSLHACCCVSLFQLRTSHCLIVAPHFIHLLQPVVPASWSLGWARFFVPRAETPVAAALVFAGSRSNGRRSASSVVARLQLDGSLACRCCVSRVILCEPRVANVGQFSRRGLWVWVLGCRIVKR